VGIVAHATPRHASRGFNLIKLETAASSQHQFGKEKMLIAILIVVVLIGITLMISE